MTRRPDKRCKTRHPGITYRVRADGSRAYFVYAAGRQHSIEGGEAEALAKQADLRKRAATGVRIKPSRVPFSAVAEDWFASKNKLRPWTLKDYRSSLDRVSLPRFGHLRPAQITVDLVALLISDLEAQGLKRSTINSHLLPLSGTLDLAVRRGLIAANPCALLTRDERPKKNEPKEFHVWSDTEIATIIDCAEYRARQPESRYDYSPIIRLGLYTGLRLGELLGLQWGDFDKTGRALHVRRQWTRLGAYGPPKTQSSYRRVPLSADLTAYLIRLKLRSGHSNDTDPIFASRKGTPLSHRNFALRGFEEARSLAEIDGVTPHDMRHAFASRMIFRGVSAEVLGQLMGHESSIITRRKYIHLFNQVETDEHVRLAMQSD